MKPSTSSGIWEDYFTCPYEMSHRVKNSRRCQHLEKCRRNFRKSFKTSDPPRYVHCKYNPAHTIYPPEKKNMRTDENPDVFIRVRDEVDYNGTAIPIRIELDIKSSMTVEVVYGQSEMSLTDQADVRSNEPLLELITNSAYSIADIEGEIKV